jgi:cAMP-dependent protein kinase regulator
MAKLAEVKGHAIRLFAKGEALHALRLYDAIVAAAPLDFVARIKVADCLVALGKPELAIEVYRAVGWYALKAGHPLVAVVVARVMDTLEAESDDLLAALVVRYGRESELVGRLAARINLPEAECDIAAPDLRSPPPPNLLEVAGKRATICLDEFAEYPEAVHPIPLLSGMSETAFRRVLSTLVVRRLPAASAVIREGEPGQSFFFVATGEVRVFAGRGLGERELARLHENSIFGEMALLSAQPRSASVSVVDEADLLEVTRESLATLAGELEQVASALHGFTQERLLRNLMATNRLFRPFSRRQQRDLLRRFTSHDVAPDTDIIHQGDEGNGLFVVLSGEVEVVKHLDDGSSAALATLRAGDVFGEIALIKDAPTSAAVTAVKTSTVLFLGREYVSRIIAGVPEIKKYLEALAEDRELDTKLALDADQTADEDEIVFI